MAAEKLEYQVRVTKPGCFGDRIEQTFDNQDEAQICANRLRSKGLGAMVWAIPSAPDPAAGIIPREIDEMIEEWRAQIEEAPTYGPFAARYAALVAMREAASFAIDRINALQAEKERLRGAISIAVADLSGSRGPNASYVQRKLERALKGGA